MEDGGREGIRNGTKEVWQKGDRDGKRDRDEKKEIDMGEKEIEMRKRG